MFCNTIVLWGVVDCELDFGASRLEVFLEIASNVLATSIRVEGFDLSLKLSFAPCLKVLVRCEHFRLVS